MASPSPLLLLLLLLCFIMLCISHSSQMVLLPLTHSIPISQFNTTHHLLKSTSTRSAARFHRRHHHHQQQQQQLSLPLSPGSDYTLSLNFGSKPITLYMDTGSDLVWFPCAPFECMLCEGKPETPKPANITNRAHTISCQSTACSAAHSSMPSHDLYAIARCPLDSIETSDCSNFFCPQFYFIAKLYHQTLSISSLSLKNFTSVVPMPPWLNPSASPASAVGDVTEDEVVGECSEGGEDGNGFFRFSIISSN